MRISNKDQGTAASMVNQALSGAGVMSSNDDNVWIPMDDGPGEWVNQNGISRAFQPGDGGQSRVMSKTFIDFLKGADPNSTADDDPRLMIYVEGLNGNTDPLAQEGMPNGLDGQDLDEYTGIPNSVPNELFSSANLKLMDDADPYIIMNYAEVCFLLAEAAERGIGNVPDNAATWYGRGVRAAMQMWTVMEPGDASLEVSDAQVDTYLATYPYGGGGYQMHKLIHTLPPIHMVVAVLRVLNQLLSRLVTRCGPASSSIGGKPGQIGEEPDSQPW
jgi:hypothetical protein